jgi:hypothetical protein
VRLGVIVADGVALGDTKVGDAPDGPGEVTPADPHPAPMIPTNTKQIHRAMAILGMSNPDFLCILDVIIMASHPTGE